jgi:ABC-2 type transport system ATP-binding protein
MIKIDNLCKSFQDIKAINGLSLHIPKGKIFGLLGPNGAGKTTLISILNGILRPDSGSIKINGHDLFTQPEAIKSISALVPQNNAFYPNLTAFENLEYFAALFGLPQKEIRDRVEYCLEIASLQGYRHRRAFTFSGGIKRRLNLAIGLLNSPALLYLDEPTAGVDPQSRKNILETIKQLNQDHEMTIVYTSHYIEEVEYICDQIGIIDHGKMILTDTKSNITKGDNRISIKVKHLPDTLPFLSDPDISIMDNDIYLARTAQDTKRLANILEQLAAQKVEVTDVLFNYKRLEDIFMSLTRQELRE